MFSHNRTKVQQFVQQMAGNNIFSQKETKCQAYDSIDGR
jgi:hypothetical protein